MCPGRGNELATQAGGASDRHVKRCQGAIESFCPASFLSGGDQCGYEYGSINDDRHFRSAFLARRILLDETLVLVDALRSRVPATQVSMDGRDARRSSSQRRNSCIDFAGTCEPVKKTVDPVKK